MVFKYNILPRADFCKFLGSKCQYLTSQGRFGYKFFVQNNLFTNITCTLALNINFIKFGFEMVSSQGHMLELYKNVFLHNMSN